MGDDTNSQCLEGKLAFDDHTFSKRQRQKKSRTVFTKHQVVQLESMFYSKRYLSNDDRLMLSKKLALTENQVKVWFQNRRNKWKRDMMTKYEEAQLSTQSIFLTLSKNKTIQGEKENDLHSKKYFPINEKEVNIGKLTDCCYGNTTLLKHPDKFKIV